ncbi:maleylpyruvate isomerase family mycothiol-dependent enzyme [Streptomyces sp. BBFR102]|uniref:maleylpyruvate isomerase family mycothiol-dependent enzyme n=1 Tax=Streptomyces sp. BBFR102 TaxID=3448171 RepID=UPI003F5329D7
MTHRDLSYDRYCDEVTAQMGLLRRALAGADLRARVPTCPEWTLRDLAVHVGGATRWMNEIVRSRASAEVPEEAVPQFAGPPGVDGPEALDAWLVEGAEAAAEALREAGPGRGMWTWSWDRSSSFWARRLTLELLVHRADACLAAGVPFAADAGLAADAVDEWLEIVAYVQRVRPTDPAGELRGAHRTLHLHATDAAPGVHGEWLIELTDDGFAVRPEHADGATVELRGPMSELMLAFYRRLPLTGDEVEVRGDRSLLDFWLERATFG